MARDPITPADGCYEPDCWEPAYAIGICAVHLKAAIEANIVRRRASGQGTLQQEMELAEVMKEAA